MAAQRHTSYISLPMYLALEEAAETKSEYFDGEIVSIPGSSRAHVEIIRNLSSELAVQLSNSSCEWFPGELLVYSPIRNSVFHPDLTVTCAEPEFANTRLATLLNPTLIIEVLSDSTEAKDRGEKFACYQTMVSLGMYVLVAQDRPLVETYTRQPDGSWRYEVFSGIASVVPLPAIDCRLRLEEIYADIPFPLRPNEEESEDSAEAIQQD